MTGDTDARTQLTRSLRRSIGLLRLLATRGQVGWRLSDLARRTALDPGTVHRLLAALADERLVNRVPDSRHYTLGPLAYELGLAAAPYYDLGRVAEAPLAALARELRGSVFLKIRSGQESVCLARHDGPTRGEGLMLDVGGRRPLCGTAGGIAMWMTLPRSEQRAVEVANRAVVNERDPAHWPGVRRMLARSRKLGLAVNLGDTVPGICSVAVPLTCAGRPGLAAVALAASGAAWSEARAQALAERLRAADLGALMANLRY
ncbi:MAG: helix-turn-helix domain-containing protein [Burkholderiales bacterium]|nr:helix-turn-helix domain-containing protein [Burkholderiales bacterium]